MSSFRRRARPSTCATSSPTSAAQRARWRPDTGDDCVTCGAGAWPAMVPTACDADVERAPIRRDKPGFCGTGGTGAAASLVAVATASRLPTATRGSNNSYTTSWDTTNGRDFRHSYLQLVKQEGFTIMSITSTGHSSEAGKIVSDRSPFPPASPHSSLSSREHGSHPAAEPPANLREWEDALKSFGSDQRRRDAIQSSLDCLSLAQRRYISQQLRANQRRVGTR